MYEQMIFRVIRLIVLVAYFILTYPRIYFHPALFELLK